ncbi:hypothetical protein [Streptomyces sp. NPDC055036]
MITSFRREFIVPAERPWGAAYIEVYKAVAVAESAYREAHGLTETAVLPDDALRMTTGDDAIVISFTVEETDHA